MSATTSPERESFDDRALECPVCVSFLVEPLTLDCGHSFCRACLLQSTRLAPDGRCQRRATGVFFRVNFA